MKKLGVALVLFVAALGASAGGCSSGNACDEYKQAYRDCCDSTHLTDPDQRDACYQEADQTIGDNDAEACQVLLDQAGATPCRHFQ